LDVMRRMGQYPVLEYVSGSPSQSAYLQLATDWEWCASPELLRGCSFFGGCERGDQEQP